MGIVLFDNPSKVVKDKRVINAILRRAAKKNNVPKGIKMEASPWVTSRFTALMQMLLQSTVHGTVFTMWSTKARST